MEQSIAVPGLRRRRRGRCQQCGEVSELLEYHGFDLVSNPGGKVVLEEGEFFKWRCPKCGFETDIAYPCWYLDPHAKLGVALIPDLTTGSEGDALQRMDQRLGELGRPDMIYRAVGTFFAVQELVHIRDADLDDRVIQLIKPLLIGQLQSQGEVVWNGFFVGAGKAAPGEQEPLNGVLYASEGPDMSPYGKTIYWFDIHLTNRQVVRMGANEVLFRLCQGLLERTGNAGPDDGRFHLYDLNWAINVHNWMQQG